MKRAGQFSDHDHSRIGHSNGLQLTDESGRDLRRKPTNALERVEPGLVEIIVPFAAGLTQQDGFFHAGVVIVAMDSACGYAAFTLMQPDVRVLTVELKVKLFMGSPFAL